MKVVPRKPSLSCSSRESSSPDRYAFQSSLGGAGSLELNAGSKPTVSASPLNLINIVPSHACLQTNIAPCIVSKSPGSNPPSASIDLMLNNTGVVGSKIPVIKFPCATRTIAKISKEDVAEKVKFWENAVVCYVTSANPSLYVVMGFVCRIWKDLSIDRIGMVNRGVFVVRFLQKEQQVKACNMNGILFDRKPFVVKPWSTHISFEKSSLTTIPI